jgi:hypothetical protein
MIVERIHADSSGKSWLEFDLSGPPGLIEPGLQRAIQARKGVPPFAGNDLHPVVFLAGRRFGSEIYIHRTVGID